MVIGAAMRVHSALGPGLLESTYEVCLAAELQVSGVSFERQRVLPVRYRDLHIDSGYRVDLIVEGCLVVELKSVSEFDSVHLAQVLTYLKLSGCTLGLLINFNVSSLRAGLRRVVLNHRAP